MSPATLQRKFNERMAKKQKIAEAAISVIIKPAMPREIQAVISYFADKQSDYYRAKANGRAYRNQFPGKDSF